MAVQKFCKRIVDKAAAGEVNVMTQEPPESTPGEEPAPFALSQGIPMALTDWGPAEEIPTPSPGVDADLWGEELDPASAWT